MNQNTRLILFWMAFVLPGILLALFLGIGWLFLLLTLRRAIVIIPELENRLRQQILGMPAQPPIADPRVRRINRILGIVTLLAWSGLTIVAFVQLNFPLLDVVNTP